MGSGKTKSSSTQTTTSMLPANQQRNVDTLLNGALQYFNSGGRTFFPGELVASFDPLQTAGQDKLVDYVSGSGGNFVNQALDANSFAMDPNQILNPENIPGFQGSVDALSRNYAKNLTENILPYVRSGGTSSGQYGGSATGIGEALSVERSNQALGDTLENMYLGAYGQGLNTFNQALNRAPSLFGLGALPGQIMADVGAERQGQKQREIQADVARHEFEQNEPIFLLQLLRDLTGSAGQYGGTQKTEATQTQKTSSSPVTQALGGALSLASLWNPMTSMFASLPQAAGSGTAGVGRNALLNMFGNIPVGS